MKGDMLTFYPKPRFRNYQLVYPFVRYEYLFTDRSNQEIAERYDLYYKTKPYYDLVRQIKSELGLDYSDKRHFIQERIACGELKVEEWI